MTKEVYDAAPVYYYCTDGKSLLGKVDRRGLIARVTLNGVVNELKKIRFYEAKKSVMLSFCLQYANLTCNNERHASHCQICTLLVC